MHDDAEDAEEMSMIRTLAAAGKLMDRIARASSGPVSAMAGATAVLIDAISIIMDDAAARE